MFSRIGRFVLRVASLGRLKPVESARLQPLVSLLGAIVATGPIFAIGFWLNSAPEPKSGRNLFDTRSSFEAYVSRMNLAAVPTAAAVEQLTSAGFSCETFSEGNVACFREVKGSFCGERQFVDLFVPGKDGAVHTVSTRFGRVCL